MADLSPFFIPENSSEELIAQTINLAFHTIEEELNSLTGANVVDGTLTVLKVKDGAVPQTDVDALGAANKIAKRNATGDLIMIDGAKLFFQFTD